MNKFIEKFSGKINGLINGFDRIVFKGLIFPIVHAKGAMNFFQYNGILFKDYKNWIIKQTSDLIKAVEKYAISNSGRGIQQIASSLTRKEELVHKLQEEKAITKGLIGVFSCVEAGTSFKAIYCEGLGHPLLKYYQTRCKHLYFYFDHEDYGFMNIRLQTWFPYHIQICMNGREWLKRHLEQQGIDFLKYKNKFLDIGNYEAAQNFFNIQLSTRWKDILDSFVPIVFPTMNQVFGTNFSYYWTMWQSEWATDLIFKTADSLKSITDSLLRHAIMTGTSERVLRYMDRPFTKAGKPLIRSKDKVTSRVFDFNDGVRVRHWVDNNSVKVYNEQNVLRIETTINCPKKFRAHRNKQGENPAQPKKLRPLRKGIADVSIRAKISQDVNNRFMSDLAEFKNETPVIELFKDILHSQIKNGSRIRALDPTGKDREILQTISDPAFRISGLTNKMLREKLCESPLLKNKKEKQNSAKISRYLRMLRLHGILRKLPKQNRYQLTDKGIQIITSLNALLAASTEQLMKMVA